MVIRIKLARPFVLHEHITSLVDSGAIHLRVMD